MEILKVNDRGEVLIPAYTADAPPDLQGDIINAAELYAAMSRWAGRRELRLQHGADALPAGLVTVLGCFMTGRAYKGDGFTVPALTWALHLKIDLEQQQGQEIWSQIKDGKLTGLSIGGSASVSEFIAGGDN